MLSSLFVKNNGLCRCKVSVFPSHRKTFGLLLGGGKVQSGQDFCLPKANVSEYLCTFAAFKWEVLPASLSHAATATSVSGALPPQSGETPVSHTQAE